MSSKTIDTEPCEFADLLFGVGSATPAGPTLPNGSIHPSPETLKNDCGGYTRGEAIVGFGQLYTSGAGGKKSYGNFLLTPTTSRPPLSREEKASFAVNERAKCYEYSVKLENGINASVTPAHNAAIYSFEYPKDKDAYLILDVAGKLDIEAAMNEGYISVDTTENLICGGGSFFGNWNKIDYDLYFAMRFDEDLEEIGIYKEDSLIPVFESMTFKINEAHKFGAYVKLKNNVSKIKAVISISFVSAEKAKEFLYEQIDSFDYERVKKTARKKWNQTLGVIEIDTDDSLSLCRFYTAMYHMNIQPRDRTNDHGNWDDFHTVWDSWRTLFPMYSLLYPNKMGAIIDSMIDRAIENEKSGLGIVIADSYLAGKEYLAGQGGNDSENVIVDGYLKSIPLNKHTWNDAYLTLLKSAETMRSSEYIKKGYATKNRQTVSGLPYSYRFCPASATMGFAFNDKAIARMAQKLGRKKEFEKYEERSLNWQNVWNCGLESEGFRSFPQARDENDVFDNNFDAHGGYNSHFYEATAWDASYTNFTDLPNLIQKIGGKEAFIKRLVFACEHSVNYYNDDNGKEGYLNFTNEPSFHIPWLFCADEIKRPDIAARTINGVIKRFSQGKDYPGDEDNGAMASYYIFMLCGFFPFSTTDNYYLHGTRLKKISFHLENGKELTVTSENVGTLNIYVQSATWQGKPLNSCRLTHAQITEGGALHFVMGDKPSEWAQK